MQETEIEVVAGNSAEVEGVVVVEEIFVVVVVVEISVAAVVGISAVAVAAEVSYILCIDFHFSEDCQWG